MNAIVIGSGIGGSAAALLLARAGIRTTLIEKNRRLGGSCASYEKQGFRIDIGTHMFSRGAAGPLGDVLRLAGACDAIDFRRTHDIAELRVVSSNHALLRLPVPAQLRRMPRFALDACRALGLTPREAIRVGGMFAHIVAMSEAEIAAHDHETVEEFLAPFTDHAPTLALFGFLLGLYFVLPYWEVSAGEAIWAFQKMARDNALAYPIGGSSAVPTTFTRLAGALGAEIRAGAGARRIRVERGAVAGVELEDGTLLPASIVVSTASVRTTVCQLVGEAAFPEAYVDRVRRIRGSLIAVQAKVGLRRRLIDAGCLVGGVGESVDLLRIGHGDLKGLFGAVAAGRVPDVIPFYCPIPTNFDPALAPPGCQLLTACAVAPTSDIPLQDPGPAWEEALLRTLRRVVPGLDAEILFIDRMSVAFIESWTGKEFGAAISTGQTPAQVGRHRPGVATPVRGLYLAGCGAGGRGVGTELAAASAIECVDRVLSDLGRSPLARPPGTAAERARGQLARLIASPIAWATRA